MALTEKGFIRPSFTDIYKAQVQRAKALFGAEVDMSEQTPLGKYTVLNCESIDELWQTLELVYYSRFPDSAFGQSLDRLSTFAGIRRNPATHAIHRVILTGKEDAVIPAGFLISTFNRELDFYTMESVTLSDSGTDVKVACTTKGIVGNVQPGTIEYIVNPAADVNGVTHVELLESGFEIERDTSLRFRYKSAVSGLGTNSLDAIRAAVLRVPGVRGATLAENATDFPTGDLLPHSFAVYVLAPDSANQEIGEAIFAKKPAGIQSIGDIGISVLDDSGLEHEIHFYKTTQKDIWIRLTVHVDRELFSETSVEVIKTNIVEEIEVLPNGGTVYLTKLFKQIYIDGVVNAFPLKLSTEGTQFTVGDVHCESYEVPRTDTSKIEVEVVFIA